MFNNAYRIVTCNKEEEQIYYASNEYNDVFENNGHDASAISKKEIEGVLQKASSRRSYYFFVFSKNSHGNRYNESAPVAVYGVKGGISTGRSTMYIETFACDKEELKGDGFYNRVIKASYIDENLVNKARNIEELKKNVNQTSQREEYAPSNKPIYWLGHAINVLSRILSEYNSGEDRKVKIVLFLNDAEKSSLPFLGLIYYFFPFELRNKFGFMTNVDANDIKEINANGNSLPVVLITMDSAFKESMLEDSYNDDHGDVLYIDADEPYNNLINGKREDSENLEEYRELLVSIENKLKSGSAARKQFDDAESQIMKEKKPVNGLSAYKDIAYAFLEQEKMSGKKKGQKKSPELFESNTVQSKKPETEVINGHDTGDKESNEKNSEDKDQRNQQDGYENSNGSIRGESDGTENREDIIIISRKKFYFLLSFGTIIVIISLMAAIHNWTTLNEIRTAQNEIIRKLDTINPTVEGWENEINTFENSTADERNSEGIDMSNSPRNIHFSDNGVEGGNPGIALEQSSASSNNQTREQGTDNN